MARRRQPRAESAELGARDNLTQQDEADVVASVGAEPDDDTGELAADPEKVLAAGGVDAESIRENERVRGYIGKKRGNVKNVPFNVGDVLTKYDTLLKLLPANSIDIGLKRTTGTAVQYTITSRPRSGTELYDAIKNLHGAHEEAEYEVRFLDNNSKEFRGIGRITMPDTRGSAPQQGQPMNPYNSNPFAPAGYPPPAPPGYPIQPGYPPPGYPPGYQPPPPAAAPPMQSPPQVIVQPQGQPNFEEMMASMRSMFDFFRTMQPAPAPQPQQPVAPPPPPSGTPDMPAMMAWMRQMYEFAQTMQQQPQPGGMPPQPMNPMAAMAVPPMTPPPGTIWIPGLGFAPLDRVAQLFGAPPSFGGARMGPPGGSNYGPRAYPDGAPPPPRQEPPPRPQNPTEQFRDALSLVRTVSRMAQEITDIMPGGGNDAPEAPVPQVDEGPIKIIDTGQAKVLVNASDGSLRGWETVWANVDKIFKWVGDQGEAFRRAQAEKNAQAQAQTPRQLPPGYVEAGPGYQPPPGQVAVVVDPASIPYAPPQQQGLPPPPASVPPPVQARRTWGAPVIPFERGEG